MQNEPLNQVTAQEARTQLSDLINRAVYARQSSLITRQGKPVAVLVSFEEWKQLMEHSTSPPLSPSDENPTAVESVRPEDVDPAADTKA